MPTVPRRLWSNRLWILAALLGAATIYTMVVIVHDDRDARNAAHIVVVSAATQIAERANHRLEVMALETFAPALHSERVAAEAVTPRDVAREHEHWARCNCRNVLPALAFFRYLASSNALAVAPSYNDSVPVDSALARVISEIAREHAVAPIQANFQLTRLSTDKRLGDLAAVTIVQGADKDHHSAVFGALVQRRDIAKMLFEPEVVRAAFNPPGALVSIDTMSLRVSTRDSAVLYGTLDTARQSLHVHVLTSGPLRNLGIEVALSPEQLLHRHLIMPFRRERLQPLGALLLATVLVTAVAIGSARREASLARARTDFIAGVSHDLRMPLAQILLASETLSLQRERNETERVSFANSIVREARRLIGLVDNVLLFSRTGAVALKPHLQSLSVHDLFTDVIESVQLAVDDAGMSIVSAAPTSEFVVGDRSLLRQALVNLVDNAIKYGREAQRIMLSVEHCDNGRVRLQVDDEGLGVPLAERKAIFERYERLPRDAGSERTGSGLGLAVVHHIVRACSGRAWVTDAPGGGTRAILELPEAAT